MKRYLILLALLSLLVSNIGPVLAAETKWITYTGQSTSNGSALTLSIPLDWSLARYKGGNTRASSPRYAVSSGRHSILIEFKTHEKLDGRTLSEERESMTLDAYISYLAQKEKEKFKSGEFIEIKREKDVFSGHNAYRWEYEVKSGKYSARLLHYLFIIDGVGYDVNYRAHPELFEDKEEIAKQVMDSIKISNWSPFKDAEGKDWIVKEQPWFLVTDVSPYFDKARFSVQHPPAWGADLNVHEPGKFVDRRSDIQEGLMILEFLPQGLEGSEELETKILIVMEGNRSGWFGAISNFFERGESQLKKRLKGLKRISKGKLSLPNLKYASQPIMPRQFSSRGAHAALYESEGTTKAKLVVFINRSVMFNFIYIADQKSYDANLPIFEKMMTSLIFEIDSSVN